MDHIKPKVLSLFSGAGGLDIGFLKSGFKIVGCIDNDKWSVMTLEKNNPKLKIMGPPYHHGDIFKISSSDILTFFNIEKNEIDLIIGGPPCQPFSVASSQRFLKEDNRFKRIGYKDTKRGTLILEYLRLIKELEPNCFVLENVPGILTIDGGEQINLIKNELKSLGYKFHEPSVVDLVFYAVPQYRKRVFLMGSQKRKISLPTPVVSGESDLFHETVRTVSHSFYRMDKDLLNHVIRNHKTTSLDRYKTINFGKREKLGRVDRLDPYKPSKTVIGGGSNGGGRSHLHPFIPRTITVRESARLQTFNDDYIFFGPMGRQFTQVGNSVPPLFSRQLAKQILNLVFNINDEWDIKDDTHLWVDLTLNKLVQELYNQSRLENTDYSYETNGHFDQQLSRE